MNVINKKNLKPIMAKPSAAIPASKTGLGTYNLTPNEGLSIVEIVIVIAITITAFAAIFQVAFLGRRAQTITMESTAAYILAREDLEAVRSIRDGSWDDVAVLAPGTAYYTDINSEDEWELSSSDPGPVGIYTKWIEVEEVTRDSATDNITSGSGYTDVDTIKVVSFVSWSSPSAGEQTISLEAILTNWQEYR
ncbi:MAG: hypothetical protein WDZ39_01545 [Candidatus Spechtbacterales bacterium]